MSAPLPLTLTFAAGLSLLFAAVSARAETPARNDTVHGYAKTAPECLAWSDGCVICARDETGAPHCSTPGIACIAAEVTCKVSKSQ